MATSKPEYRLRPEAGADMARVWLYTRDKWGLQQANAYTDELTAAFALFAKAPKRAPACDHIRQGYRFAKTGRHVIYFRETDYGIEIVRVLHDRMLPSRHL